MIGFNLDRSVRLTFYEQIKGQLLSAIYCGKIRAGDRLPSIREVSDDLGINYKTTRKIYLKLAEENYLEIVKGSGAFLKERSGEASYEQMRRQAVFNLLGEVSDKARSLGLSPAKFSDLLDAYWTGTDLRELHLAVVDHEEEAYVFSRELELRMKRVRARSVSLGDVDSEAARALLRDSEFLLTTSYHLEEVKELARRFRKRLVEIKPSHEIYREVLSAARHENVAIVVRDEDTLHASWDVFMNLYHPSTEMKFWIAPISRQDLIEKIVRDADLIFVSPMCWDEMRKRTPPAKTLKTYDKFISQETIDQLRALQLLG